jgi:phytoene dehydrogenase-like protein
VVAGFPAWKLADFVEGTEMLTQKASRVPPADYTVFLRHLALKEAPEPICDKAFHKMGFTTMAEINPQKILGITQDVSSGRLPKDFSAAYVCATNHDPSRAPAGCHTLYLYHMVPARIARGEMSDWSNHREAFSAWMLDHTRKYVPNLSNDNILGSFDASPQWIADSSPSYKDGDVGSLAMYPEQFIYGRPIPELAQYRVPGVKNLYLCGPFMHPGGGANGGGRAAAIRIMMDYDMDVFEHFML